MVSRYTVQWEKKQNMLFFRWEGVKSTNICEHWKDKSQTNKNGCKWQKEGTGWRGKGLTLTYIYTHTPIIQFQLCNHALHNQKNYIEKKNRFTEN